ncbi:hypothetical protein BH10PSE11_BH10PSE11_04980 [soil metagenome]
MVPGEKSAAPVGYGAEGIYATGVRSNARSMTGGRSRAVCKLEANHNSAVTG